MAQSFGYQLSFAGVPFVLDRAKVFRQPPPDVPHGQSDQQTAIRKQQPEVDLIDEINRYLPIQYLQDFALPSAYKGRNLGAIAHQWQAGPLPDPHIRIGDWYYPTTASRWSVFRGLATSSQVAAMLRATAGGNPGLFVMQATPQGAVTGNRASQGNYTLQSPMYMLPPRPIGETAGTVDGLYLITLVDERYYWQYNPITIEVMPSTTWAAVINQCANALGIVIGFTPIESVYTQPEADSQFWCNQEQASILLDAVAWNTGRTVVRLLDGSYLLQTPVQSQTTVNLNRGNALSVVRLAGGEIFTSGNALPVGDLTQSRNSVLPVQVNVTYPLYVVGDDPVPHFVNPRTQGPRPASRWYEQSYGAVYDITIPLLSGNLQAPLLSGGLNLPISGASSVPGSTPLPGPITGTSGVFHVIHDTAKAFISGEIAAVPLQVTSGLLSGVIPGPGQSFSGAMLPVTPLNQSGLLALSLRLASDYYNNQMVSALDEVYPGTFAWIPEGIHDIIWTYSEKARYAGARVMRSEWNQIVREMQHHAPPFGTFAGTPRGIGGVSVAQTWRDSASGSPIISQTQQTLGTTDQGASILPLDYLPTQNRWWGQIDNEVLLFEGTSGGQVSLSGGNNVGIVFRGANGTIPAPHNNNTPVTYLDPNVAYGTNLITTEKGAFVYPGQITSGGVSEVRVVPQTQTVTVFTDNSIVLNGVPHYSGVVNAYDNVLLGGNRYQPQETVWVIRRNNQVFQSGQRYDGQFVGYSPTQGLVVNSGVFSSGILVSGVIPVSGVLPSGVQAGSGGIIIGSGTFGSGFTTLTVPPAPVYLANVGGVTPPAPPTSGPPTSSGTQLNVVTNVCCQSITISGTGTVPSGTALLANFSIQFTPIFFASGSVLGSPLCTSCPNSGPACCQQSSGSALPCFPLYCGCPVFPKGMAQQVSFTASGFVNGTCSECSRMSGTIVLSFVPGAACCWQGNDFTLCGQNCFWQLCTISGGATSLVIEPGGLLQYNAAATTPPWDGQSALTLFYTGSAGGACQSNTPPSITVTPFPNTSPCSGCPTAPACCSGTVIPTTLNAFITAINCNCLPPGIAGKYRTQLTGMPDGTWAGSFDPGFAACCNVLPCSVSLVLGCASGGNWSMCTVCGPLGGDNPLIDCKLADTTRCQPFEVTFSNLNFGKSPGDCAFCAPGDVNVTVTL